jgi:hypothetical protein
MHCAEAADAATPLQIWKIFGENPEKMKLVNFINQLRFHRLQLIFSPPNCRSAKSQRQLPRAQKAMLTVMQPLPMTSWALMMRRRRIPSAGVEPSMTADSHMPF